MRMNRSGFRVCLFRANGIGWILAFLTAVSVPRLFGRTADLSVEEYRDKVYASWLAQCVGNIYGLPHECRYIDSPGPDVFPLGYRETRRLKEAGGAFSDDDTDIEYMYLLAMQKYGIEPTYGQLAGDWMLHVKDRVWLANRAAVAAMRYGFTPPVTGMKAYNPHWFQIDPQLVNEIWAVTAPGMVRYAAEKSAWAARIMDDDWGIEPTIHYGAMYAAAFFEKDVRKLVDIGTAALPPGGRFASTVEDMKALHRKYPDDWKRARLEMARKYFIGEPAETKTIWNANLNGACGILALLYGNGDFQRTLDLACVIGFDADNQAATMAGLIGVINGTGAIPREWLFPFPELGWTEPFNDRYRNVSRADLPDGSLKRMAAVTAEMGERIILKYGGKKVVKNGREYYRINADAGFVAPLEFPGGPMPRIEAGAPVRYPFILTGGAGPFRWTLLEGEWPKGLRFEDGILTGTAETAGIHRVLLKADRSGQTATREFTLVVRGRNLAPSATRVLANVRRTDAASRDSMYITVGRTMFVDDVEEAIRDGVLTGSGSTFLSIGATDEPKTDFYGYEWREPQTVGLLAYHNGAIEETGGWFRSIRVEYRDERGYWKPVEDMVQAPEIPTGAQPYDKANFVEYLIAFKPVRATAVRLFGEAGHETPWTGKQRYFTSLTELGVYGPLPGFERLK
jgi:hypothetical protein